MHNNNNNRRRQNTMGGGGGGQHRHNNNRPRRFTNNRPQHEGGGDPASVARTRRSATQNREKYQMMARDAQASGDRVLGEYYLQHADHYHRVLLSLPPEEVRQPHFQQRNNQHGDPQQGDGQQDGATAGSNGNGNGHNDSHNQNHNQGHDEGSHGDHSEAHALPSFITQPASPEEPRE